METYANPLPPRPDPGRPWIKLCLVSDIPAQGGKFVGLGQQALAVFLLPDGSAHVTDNACPHAGGSLSGGDLQGHHLVCPWHGWAFDIHNGACLDNHRVRLRVYPARLCDGWVEAQVEGDTQPRGA